MQLNNDGQQSITYKRGVITNSFNSRKDLLDIVIFPAELNERNGYLLTTEDGTINPNVVTAKKTLEGHQAEE